MSRGEPAHRSGRRTVPSAAGDADGQCRVRRAVLAATLLVVAALKLPLLIGADGTSIPIAGKTGIAVAFVLEGTAATLLSIDRTWRLAAALVGWLGVAMWIVTLGLVVAGVPLERCGCFGRHAPSPAAHAAVLLGILLMVLSISSPAGRRPATRAARSP